MSLRQIGRRWLVSFVLGTIAPLVVAQMMPSGAAGAGGRGRDAPVRWDCHEPADEQTPLAGGLRRTFNRQCIETRRAGTGEAPQAMPAPGSRTP